MEFAIYQSTQNGYDRVPEISLKTRSEALSSFIELGSLYPSKPVNHLFHTLADLVNGVFPKRSRTFTEFSEFRESDKSLRQELGSI